VEQELRRGVTNDEVSSTARLEYPTFVLDLMNFCYIMTVWLYKFCQHQRHYTVFPEELFLFFVFSNS
jgi:hypothetical protein